MLNLDTQNMSARDSNSVHGAPSPDVGRIKICSIKKPFLPPSHFQTFRHLCIRQLTCYVIQGCGLYPYCNNYYPFYAVVTIHLPLADCDFLYLLIKLIAEKMSSKRKSVKDKKERKQVNYFLNFPVAIVISSKSLGFCNKKMSVYRQSVRMHLLVRLPFFVEEA